MFITEKSKSSEDFSLFAEAIGRTLLVIHFQLVEGHPGFQGVYCVLCDDADLLKLKSESRF